MNLKEVVNIAFRDETDRMFQAVLNVATSKILYRAFNSNASTSPDEFVGSVEVLLKNNSVHLVHTFPVGPFDSDIINRSRVDVLREFSKLKRDRLFNGIGEFISSFAYIPHRDSQQYMTVSDNA